METDRPGTGGLEIGRLWEGLVRVCHLVRPELCAPAKFWSWNLAFKTPQPPALPDAAATRPRPKLRAEAATRRVTQIESQLDIIIR